LSGRQYVPHENLIDSLGRKLGPFQRSADHVGAELVGANTNSTSE